MHDVYAYGVIAASFGTYGKLTAESAWNARSETDIRSRRTVCVDPFFLGAAVAEAVGRSTDGEE